MTVHQIKIKNDMPDPTIKDVKQGDQIHFQLDGRTEPATVEVTQGQLFEGETKFSVGSEGKAKTINRSISPGTYNFLIRLAVRHERVPQEQTGTVNGSIVVVPN